jgi:hypothetical protein
MARKFIDISVPLENDVAADPPGYGPKIDLYEEPDVKDSNGEPAVTRVLTIMLAEEY